MYLIELPLLLQLPDLLINETKYSLPRYFFTEKQLRYRHVDLATAKRPTTPWEARAEKIWKIRIRGHAWFQARTVKSKAIVAGLRTRTPIFKWLPSSDTQERLVEKMRYFRDRGKRPLQQAGAYREVNAFVTYKYVATKHTAEGY